MCDCTFPAFVLFSFPWLWFGLPDPDQNALIYNLPLIPEIPVLLSLFSVHCVCRHLPIGVQVDRHVVAEEMKQKGSNKESPAFPWQLVVHFSEAAETDPLRLVDEDSVQSHFFNSIKQVVWTSPFPDACTRVYT